MRLVFSGKTSFRFSFADHCKYIQLFFLSIEFVILDKLVKIYIPLKSMSDFSEPKR